MSIMNEYETIKEALGEEQFNALNLYLSFHPETRLSDLYYNKAEYEKAKAWLKETPDYLKEHPPLYLVVECYKGLCEHNFFGTKKEVASDLGLSESELDNLFYHVDIHDTELQPIRSEAPTYYKRANLTYEIRIAKSIEDIKGFLKGRFNDAATNKDVPDWYYALHESRCGEEGIKILSAYSKENESLRILVPELLNALPKEKKEGILKMPYDEFLNHKSILLCESKKDIAQHTMDMDRMFSLLEGSGASAALVCARYMDAAHKDKKESLSFVPAEHFRSVMDGYDQKNGVDFVIHEDRFGLVIYGQNYTHGKEYTPGMTEVFITYQLFDDKKIDLKNLKDVLDQNEKEDETQKILSCLSKEDVFLQDGSLKEALREVKRLPLDVQIKNGEKIKQEQKQKKKGKGSKSRVKSEQKDR